MNNIKISILGDICPTTDNYIFFDNADAQIFMPDVSSILKNSDINICNVEFSIADKQHSVNKIGPKLNAPVNSIKFLRNAGINIASLANNHIRDFGNVGIDNIISECQNNNIKFLGAGRDLEEAKKPKIIEINSKKIGILSFAEIEFNIANSERYGANYLDLYEDFDRIRELKKNVDFLIILFHGGIEYYQYPSPELQKKCRKMAKCGADIITCQHSHCIGTIEKYEGSTIIYGQGNSIFGYRESNDSWNQGLLINIELLENKKYNIDYKVLVNNLNKLEIASEKLQSQVMLDVQNRSKNLNDFSFIEENWIKFCQAQESTYLGYVLGFGKIVHKLNRVLRNLIIRLIMNKKKYNILLNLIRCESHYEVLNTILKRKEY